MTFYRSWISMLMIPDIELHLPNKCSVLVLEPLQLRHSVIFIQTCLLSCHASSYCLSFKIYIYKLVTPLDVVKIRLQAQQKIMPPNRCFIYCNGLMDHCIICVNSNGKSSSTKSREQWYRRPGQFTGTLVLVFLHVL